MIASIWQNLDYIGAMVLFVIGLYAVIAKENLIKKLMGLNIMETGVFALIISLGVVQGPGSPFSDPLPQALVLLGMVMALGSTGLALGLIVRIQRQCGTIEADELKTVD